MSPPSRPKLRWFFFFPTLLYLVVASVLELTEIDLKVAHLFYDKSRHFWIYGRSPWFNEWLHEGGRDFIALIGLTGIVVFLLSLNPKWKTWRKPASYLVVSIALSTGIVAGLKQITNVDCPWDLEVFDGSRPYVRLFADRPDHLPQGRCFPGGHSSGAFSLFSVFFIVRERSSRLGILAMICVVVLGGAFAFGQWARGAHFVSHDLGAAYICWITVSMLYLGPFHARLWPHRGLEPTETQPP